MISAMAVVFDFLCRKSSIEIEVECKTVSSDLGHRVHLLRQYQLGPVIRDAMRRAQEAGLLKLAVATVADRLHGQREFMETVGSGISQTLLNRKEISINQRFSVRYYQAPIAGSPFDTNVPNLITEAAVSEYCSRIAHQELEHLIIMFSPGKDATVVAVRSSLPNQFLRYLYKKGLRVASSQFSGVRPGFICMQLRNTTNAQLLDIAEAPKRTSRPTGVQLMTSKFLGSVSRSHVHAIAYTAPGSFVAGTSRILRDTAGYVVRNTSISEDAGAYTFYNPNSCRADDLELRLI
jgi:hypothetical protein